MNTSTKPPNVLVYTGNNKEKVYENIAFNLLRNLHAEKYVVYQLTNNQVLTTPWQDNVSVLIVFCEDIQPSIADAFANYVENKGKMIIFCSNFGYSKGGFVCERKSECFETIKAIYNNRECVLYGGKFSYRADSNVYLLKDASDKAVVIKAEIGEGLLLACEVNLIVDPLVLGLQDSNVSQRLEESHFEILRSLLEDLGLDVKTVTLPKLTAGYVLSNNASELDELMQKLNIKDVSLGECKVFGSRDVVVPILPESESLQPLPFDRDLYFSNLKAKNFGKPTIFFPVVTSTMIPAGHLSQHNGVVVVAGRQLSGRGRGGNAWLSPEGSASFTLNLNLSLSSKLGQRLSCMQHICALAVVHGIRKIPAYKDLDLRLKWPNDLYFHENNKIGGVLVTTTIQGDLVCVHAGIGVNVSNSHPTVCISSAIESQSLSTGSQSLPPLSIEEVIARTLTEMELLVNDFMENGADNFLSLYYKYWIHEGQRVTVEALNEEVTVQGLDDFGFLVVQTDTGRKVTLQPDGNRFDIMRNLIVAK